MTSLVIMLITSDKTNSDSEPDELMELSNGEVTWELTKSNPPAESIPLGEWIFSYS